MINFKSSLTWLKFKKIWSKVRLDMPTNFKSCLILLEFFLFFLLFFIWDGVSQLVKRTTFRSPGWWKKIFQNIYGLHYHKWWSSTRCNKDQRSLVLSQLAADHTLKKLKFTILVLIPCLLKGQLKKGTKQFCKNMDKTKNFGFVDFLILHLMYLDQPFFLIQSKF